MLRQVTWLAGPCSCLAFPMNKPPATLIDNKLTAHSCGGSPGFAMRFKRRRTGFPLHF